jgi:hypothetical protein
MFLMRNHERNHLIFTYTDPRADGFTGDVEAGVTLEEADDVHHWPDGADSPGVCLGVSPDDPKVFKVFKYDRDRRNAGYESVGGTPIVLHSYADYAKTIAKS